MIKYLQYGNRFYAFDLGAFQSQVFVNGEWQKCDLTLTEVLHDTDRNAVVEKTKAEIREICEALPVWGAKDG